MRFCPQIPVSIVIPILAVACASNPSNATGGNDGGGPGQQSSSTNPSSGTGTGTSGASPGGTGTGTSSSTSTGSNPGSGSSSSGGGVTDGGDVTADGGGGGNPVVNLNQTDQMIEGFGINDMYLSSDLPASLFDPTNGIGLSILRLGMDTMGMGALESAANMQADIMTVQKAGGKVIGSVWTPPMNCKTNNNADNGGQLCSSSTITIASEGADQCTSTGTTSADATCYSSWAKTIATFANTNGLNAISLANEPDFASCGTNEPCNGSYPTAVYTADEMVAFVKVAGPIIKAANPNIQVIAPEASEWNHLWSNDSACGSQPSGDKSSDPLNCGCFVTNPYSAASATCTAAASAACSTACGSGSGYDYGHALHADSTAWADFDIVGIHEYDTQTAFPWPTSDFPKDKELWVTEMAGVKWWPEQGPSADINDGVVVAEWIHSALVTGEASAWLWWWYQAQSTDDNEGLLLAAGSKAPSVPTLTAPDTKRHYTLGNFSKFIRPGYKRVIVSGSAPSGVLLSAYAGPSNATVVVAINTNASTVSVPISIAGGTAPTQFTPWVTSAADNLAQQTAISVSGSSFTAALGATSVTTFVGN